MNPPKSNRVTDFNMPKAVRSSGNIESQRFKPENHLSLKMWFEIEKRCTKEAFRQVFNLTILEKLSKVKSFFANHKKLYNQFN